LQVSETIFPVLRGKVGNLNSELTKRGIPIYRANPSIPTAADIARQKRKPFGNETKGFVISETGEVLGDGVAVAYEIEEVDDERFVKLFLEGVRQATGLTRPGLKVFEMVYVLLRENPKQDTVNLSRHEAAMPKTTYYKGLRELLERKFLFRSTYESLFFVNVRYLFNGDRLAFVKAYHRKKGRRPTVHPDQTALPFIEAEADA
jgi:hypothetical protein